MRCVSGMTFSERARVAILLLISRARCSIPAGRILTQTRSDHSAMSPKWRRLMLLPLDDVPTLA